MIFLRIVVSWSVIRILPLMVGSDLDILLVGFRRDMTRRVVAFYG